jgi:hypothetical protein
LRRRAITQWRERINLPRDGEKYRRLFPAASCSGEREVAAASHQSPAIQERIEQFLVGTRNNKRKHMAKAKKATKAPAKKKAAKKKK